MKRNLLLLPLCTLPIQTAHSNEHRRRLQASTRIIGGEAAENGRYGYAQVSLRDKVGDHFCGGSVIAPDIILTAAHCVEEVERVHVNRYNFNDREEAFEDIGIVESTAHPKYSCFGTDISYDVGIIKLNRRITSTQPVRMNKRHKVPVQGDILVVTGWGATHAVRGNYPNIMQEADVDFIPFDECKRISDSDGQTLESELTETMMCAAGKRTDACYGDSGSALLFTGETEVDDVQVGITSWGYECAGDLPGVYTRLSNAEIQSFLEDQVCSMSDFPPDYLCLSAPTTEPSGAPTVVPSSDPTSAPTITPSSLPSTVPSDIPSLFPSHIPTQMPVEGGRNERASAVVGSEEIRRSSSPTSFAYLFSFLVGLTVVTLTHLVQ